MEETTKYECTLTLMDASSIKFITDNLDDVFYKSETSDDVYDIEAFDGNTTTIRVFIAAREFKSLVCDPIL